MAIEAIISVAFEVDMTEGAVAEVISHQDGVERTVAAAKNMEDVTGVALTVMKTVVVARSIEEDPVANIPGVVVTMEAGTRFLDLTDNAVQLPLEDMTEVARKDVWFLGLQFRFLENNFNNDDVVLNVAAMFPKKEIQHCLTSKLSW